MRLKDCSRRDFLKGAAGTAVGIATLGVLGACGTSTGSTPAPATPTTGPVAEPTATVPQDSVFTPDDVVDCDVVVVGVGVAGISACVEAAEMGVSVVGIDRAMSVAGTNAVSVVGIYGLGDPAELGNHFNYLTSSTHYQFNNRFVRNYLDIIDGQIERYKEKGMSIKTNSVPSSAGDFHSVQHMFSSRSTDRAAEFEAMLGGYSNLTLCWQTEVTDVLSEDGKVTGVYAKGSDGKVTQYNAKGGVIICTGGFGANLDMIAEYMGGAVALRTGSTFNDGAGIKLARSVGAQIGKNFAINATEGGALNAKASGAPNVMSAEYNAMFRSILMGDVLINKRGERFVDEAIMCKRTMMFCSEPVTREGGLYYGIMTQAEMDMLKTMTLADFCLDRYDFTITHAMILRFLASAPFPNFDQDAEKAIEEGWCWKGNTFKELEDTSGIPNIAKTMTEYNEMCENGVDTLLFKDPKFLKPYREEDGPFYLVENYLGNCCTQGGIKTDGSCRALNRDHEIIEGLYVAGMDADLESVPYIIGATCHGFSIGSGYIAAEAAASRVLE